MYPMTDPRRKSLRGAPWDGPSLTCHKKRSPNMGTKTYPSTFTLLIMMLLKKIPKHGDENTNADDIPVTTQNRLKKIPKHGDGSSRSCVLRCGGHPLHRGKSLPSSDLEAGSPQTGSHSQIE